MTQEEIIKIVVNDAIYLCRTVGLASPSFFQRSLAIDHNTAMLVFEELAKAEILVNIRTIKDEGDINYIGEVNRIKMQEMSIN